MTILYTLDMNSSAAEEKMTSYSLANIYLNLSEFSTWYLAAVKQPKKTKNSLKPLLFEQHKIAN